MCDRKPFRSAWPACFEGDRVKLPSTKENPALVIAFVRRAVTICICLAVALAVAHWIGTSQTGYLKIVAGLTVVVLVAAGLRQRAWVLIPIGCVRPTTVIVNQTTIINKTVNITKIQVVNKTIINTGPRTELIQ